MRRTLLAAGVSLSLVAPSLADPAQTLTPATMHKLPSVKSHIVQHIPAAAQIDVSSCAGGWCYGSWRDLFGYIPAGAVAGGPPPVEVAPAAPPLVVAPSVVVGPTWGWGGPYVGGGWGYGWRRW